MTPLHIELLLACYVSPDPEVYLGLERWRSSAAVTFLADLQAWGCIDGGTVRVTARAGDPVGRHAYAQFGIAAVVIGAVSWPGFSELVAVSREISDDRYSFAPALLVGFIVLAAFAALTAEAINIVRSRRRQ